MQTVLLLEQNASPFHPCFLHILQLNQLLFHVASLLSSKLGYELTVAPHVLTCHLPLFPLCLVHGKDLILTFLKYERKKKDRVSSLAKMVSKINS